MPQVHARVLGVNLGAESPNIDTLLARNPLCAQVSVQRTDANLGHRALRKLLKDVDPPAKEKAPASKPAKKASQRKKKR